MVWMGGYWWTLLRKHVRCALWLSSGGVLENPETTKIVFSDPPRMLCNRMLRTTLFRPHNHFTKKKKQTRFTVFRLSTFFLYPFPFLHSLLSILLLSLFLNIKSLMMVSLARIFFGAIYLLMVLKTVWIECVFWASHMYRSPEEDRGNWTMDPCTTS